MEHQTAMMKIEINEMAHAFRINGVTFSRKKLGELFPVWGGSLETFYRYLVMMPFLAETKDVGDAPDKIGNYAIFKAKRIQKALELYGDIIPAFMMMAAQLGNLDLSGNGDSAIGELSLQAHDHLCNCGVKKSPDMPKRVLH